MTYDENKMYPDPKRSYASNKKRLLAVCSGGGQIFEELVLACQRGEINGEYVGMVATHEDIPAITRATRLGIPVSLMPFQGVSRYDYDELLNQTFHGRDVDYITLVGYKRILSPVVVHLWERRILNLHPALLPAFQGFDPQKRALEAGVKVTGCTVHFVDEGVDTGPILTQRAVDISTCTTVDEVCKALRPAEIQCYIAALKQCCN